MAFMYCYYLVYSAGVVTRDRRIGSWENVKFFIWDPWVIDNIPLLFHLCMYIFARQFFSLQILTPRMD
jgi:hypothetical protein